MSDTADMVADLVRKADEFERLARSAAAVVAVLVIEFGDKGRVTLSRAQVAAAHGSMVNWEATKAGGLSLRCEPGET